MSSGVSIEGLAALKAKLATTAAELRAVSARAVAEEVRIVEEDAREGAPEVTGALRRSIRGHSEGAEGQVETSLRYAGFVEHGTGGNPAQPFMQPAAERSRMRFPRAAADLIKGVLR